MSKNNKIQFIYIDNNVEINEFSVLKLNYEINLNEYSLEDIKSIMDTNIDNILKSCEKKYILLLDLGLVKNKNLNIDALKYIINSCNIERCTEYVHKCLVYNYNEIFKTLLKILTSLLLPENKKKIIYRNKIPEINPDY